MTADIAATRRYGWSTPPEIRSKLALDGQLEQAEQDPFQAASKARPLAPADDRYMVRQAMTT